MELNKTIFGSVSTMRIIEGVEKYTKNIGFNRHFSSNGIISHGKKRASTATVNLNNRIM